MADKDHGPRIGADPELFVQNKEGKVVPICGMIGGTKEAPLVVNNLVEAAYGVERTTTRTGDVFRRGDYAIQEDNVMLEFNVPAYMDHSHFQIAISKIIGVLETQVLPKHEVTIKYDVMSSFKPEEIEKFPQAFAIGCMPDLDAYADEGKRERIPFNAGNFGFHRFCGGHLHIQYNHNAVPRHVFAQFMDIMVELPFMRFDRQKMRRKFYGQPGLYREKPYGIEYRTPSNFWVEKRFRDNWLGTMLDNVMMLAREANKNPEELKRIYSNIYWDDVQEAIKTENVKLADSVIEHCRNSVGLYVSQPATK